jgi:hypothetical protein
VLFLSPRALVDVITHHSSLILADQLTLKLAKCWIAVDKHARCEFKKAVQEIGEDIGDCLENWSGVWGVRKIIEIRSGI